MNHHYRSGRDHYGNEIDQDHYPSAGYSTQGPSYPNVANLHINQQHAMFAQLGQAHRGGIQHFIPEDIRYYDRMQQNDFNNVDQPIYYKHPQSLQKEVDHRHERLQEKRDDERYTELYGDAFAPNSRTTISGTRTSTERTRGLPPHTSSSSRSTSRYGSSTTSSSESDDVNWEDNIMSALNDMAGNLKKIGGIHCNQAGPDTTEVQLKLNLPLPMEYVDNLDVKEGFNNAMASLSPKKCGNMQYGYSHLDEHVIDMEERFLGTMDQIQGNMMPVYKSLFQTQSESSDDDDDDHDDDYDLEEDQSESTYEDPRFLANIDQNLQQLQNESTNVVQSPIMSQDVDKIPFQIILSNPSGVSSADSWKLMPLRDEPREHPDRSATNKIITIINNNLDVALRSSRRLSNENESNRRNEQPVPASKQTHGVTNREAKESKSKKHDVKANTEIPQVINVGNGENVPGCYSDLTLGFQMSTQPCDEKDKSTSNIPAIKTQFSGDEIMGRRNKASFQRNSSKKGTTFDSGVSHLREDKAIFDKVDPPTTISPCSRSHSINKSTDARELICKDGDKIIEKMKVEEGPDDEYANNCRAKKKPDERGQLHEEREETRMLEDERSIIEAEAKSALEALESKRLEERVAAEIMAAREALKANKLEEKKKKLEAEAKASEAKRLEEEEKKREIEVKAVEEAQRAKRLEEEKKRIEAEAIAAQEALEAKRLEGERKRREAEERAAQEALKAKKLEEERKRIEVETKAAQEALEILYAKKLNEERRLREVEAKLDEEKRQRHVKTKALEATKFEKEKTRIKAETKAVEKALEARESKVKRKRREAKTKTDKDEKECTSLYRVQGFEDYCKSISSAKVDVDDHSKALRTNIDISDEDRVVERLGLSTSESNDTSEQNTKSTPSHEEESGAGAMGFGDETDSRNSSLFDTYSSDEESDIFTDATSFVEDSESKMITSTSDVRSSTTTKRLRNRIDVQSQNVEIKYLSERSRSVNHPFSSEETVYTMDKTVQSKDPSRESTGSLKSFSNSKLPMKSSKLSSYTSDVTIPIASTMSTLQTFDQGTVYSGQHSLGRFVKSSEESIISSASSSHHSAMSSKPVAQCVSAFPRKTKKKSIIEPESRSSILGRILSFILSLVLRIIFTIILFSYTWIKHMMTTIGKRRASKIDCTPTQFALQPDQAIRREEIQDRSMDNLIHKNAVQQYRIPYLGYEDPLQEHYTTTMIIKHPSSSKSYFADESDEVGTCVESIVPDAHNPNISDGKISTWKITQNNTETSSLSYPPSTSFHVLKSAYSALSSTRREGEKSNWLDQPTIDDEMSYYE